MSFVKKDIFFTVKPNERIFRIFFEELKHIFRSSFVCQDKPYVESRKVNTQKDISALAVKSSSAKMLNFCVNGH